jgi:cytoskeletal protein RodZ
MLSKTLKKLRAKPESTRRLIALSVSLGITAIVFVAWGVSFVPYAMSTLNTASVKDAFPDLKNAANGTIANDGERAVEINDTNTDRNTVTTNNGYNANAQNDGVPAFVDSSLVPVYDDYNTSVDAQATTTDKALIQ